jgi:acyl-CoA synthetase (AMP-forming)/AMP-acid ligase II
VIELDAAGRESSAIQGTRGRSYRAAFDERDFAPATAGVWRYLSAATRWPVELELLPRPHEAVAAVADFPEIAHLADARAESVLTLFTSGTTGTPKPVPIPVVERFRRIRPGTADDRWILTYAPFRWAGVSVLLHVLQSGAKVVVPATLDADAILGAASETGVTHVSLTPSLFRRIQLGTPPSTLRRIPFRQITFGGEYATQDVLDQAARLWPAARVTHVYAATEFGDLWAVSDGRAGCPAER